MTPPLKYRAWHEPTQSYLPLRNIMLDASGSPIAISSGGLDSKRIPISEVTLERWTGRYDRTGAEVFEGDLIQRYIEPAHGYFYASTITVVEWRETNTYTGFSLTERTTRRIEVVGNRHQHAAMLEGITA